MHMKFILLAATAYGLSCSIVQAKTTFLPDWQNAGLNFGSNEGDFNRDEPLCIEAVDQNGKKLYHKAKSCPQPKIFDEYCPHDNDYISECYCPAIYQYSCVAPYRGDERVKDKGYASCDGLYIACCDGSCPSGTSKSNPGGCGGSTTNDCGDTCYYPYKPCCYPASDETGCSCGTYTCGDGCGGYRTCCSSCPEPDPDPTPSSSGSSSSSSSSSNSSGSGGGGGSNNSGGEGSIINGVLQKCGVGNTNPPTCPNGSTPGYIEYACHRGHSNHVNFDCRDGQYYCDADDGTRTYFNRFEWPDGC